MAILQPPKSRSRIISEELPPKGTFIAVCIDVEDRFGVVRKKYESEETEVVDLTRFYFGIKAKDGRPHVVASKDLKLSSHDKSAMVQFLAGWLGDKPKAGFDTQKMMGAGAQITVSYTDGNGGRRFANISSISPVMEGMEKSVPPITAFEGLLEPSGKPEVEQEDDIKW